MKKTSVTILCVSAIIAIAGCQKAPTAELTAAQAALSRADSLEADVYVADLYSAALDSLNTASSEIETENAKSSLSRNYGHARELIAFATSTAQEAEGRVETVKQQMSAEADSLIALAQQLSAAATSNKMMQSGDAGAPSVATLLNEAVTARGQGDFKTARDLAQEAVERLGVQPGDQTPRS